MRTLLEVGTAIGTLVGSFGTSGDTGTVPIGIAVAVTLLSLVPTVDRLASAGMGIDLESPEE